MSAHRVVFVILGLIVVLTGGEFVAEGLGERANSVWLSAGIGFALIVTFLLATAGFWERAREEGFFYFGESKEVVLQGKMRILGWLFYAVILGACAFGMFHIFTTLPDIDYSLGYVGGVSVGAMIGPLLRPSTARTSDETP